MADCSPPGPPDAAARNSDPLGFFVIHHSAMNPSADAFHSVSMYARLDLSKYWFRNDSRGFALFLNAYDLLNQAVWLPSFGGGPAATQPAIPGRSIFLGIEVWQKKDR